MCDTFVALGNSTKNGFTIFGKNSDRDPNEAHFIELSPEMDHKKGETVKCTYIDIPQVAHTNRVLLAKPFWIWGAEMGANEYGVTIGNEAVFTRVKDVKIPRLLGMDLLRLALERSRTAEEAMYVIIDLLEKYGQGGNCGFAHPFFYDNSFLMADATCAWVLETAGQHWVAEKVKDIRSISNRLTIGKKWDLASEDLISYALNRGWCKKKEDFNFAQCYSDPFMNYVSGSLIRLNCTEQSLWGEKGDLTVRSTMEILRKHPTGGHHSWTPDKGFLRSDVCMHIGVGPIRINQTTGSMVSEIAFDDSIHWFTMTSTPCLGIFKPFWINSRFPSDEAKPSGTFNESSLWWRHESFIRKAILNYNTTQKLVVKDQEEIEDGYEYLIEKSRAFSIEKRYQYSKEIIARAEEKLKAWKESNRVISQKQGISLLYLNMLKKLNKAANLRA